MCIWRHVKLLTYKTSLFTGTSHQKHLMYTMWYKIGDKQPAPKKKHTAAVLEMSACRYNIRSTSCRTTEPRILFWEEEPKSDNNRADILNIFHNEWIRDRTRRQEETWRKVHRSMGLAFPFVRAYWALLALALKNVAKCFMCLPRYSS